MSFTKLHEDLHSLREGIGGDDWKTPEWLQRKIKDILAQAYTASPIDIDAIRELQAQLATLQESEKSYDVAKRIEIDQLACRILNAQEGSI